MSSVFWAVGLRVLELVNRVLGFRAKGLGFSV